MRQLGGKRENDWETPTFRLMEKKGEKRSSFCHLVLQLEACPLPGAGFVPTPTSNKAAHLPDPHSFLHSLNNRYGYVGSQWKFQLCIAVVQELAPSSWVGYASALSVVCPANLSQTL